MRQMSIQIGNVAVLEAIPWIFGLAVKDNSLSDRFVWHGSQCVDLGMSFDILVYWKPHQNTIQSISLVYKNTNMSFFILMKGITIRIEIIQVQDHTNGRIVKT